jgi:hypothetical protein
MADWAAYSRMGQDRWEIFYDNTGTILAADHPDVATGPSIKLPAYVAPGSPTVPLARAILSGGEGKLVKRDGNLLFPNVTPPTGATPFWFDTADPINRKIPTNATYLDNAQLHTVNGSGQRQWWISTGNTSNTCAAWDNTGQTTNWTLVLPAFEGRPANTVTVKAPPTMTNGGGSDNGLSIIDFQTIPGVPIIWDMWQTVVDNTNKRVTCNGWGLCYGDGTVGQTMPGRNFWVSGNSFGDGPVGGQDFTSGKGAGIRASNSSWFSGVITLDDYNRIIAGGEIEHALCCAVRSEMRASASVAPATGYETSGPPTGVLKNGARICIPRGQFPSSYNNMTPLCKAIVRCLQEYGCYVMDGTGAVQINIYADAGSDFVGPNLTAPCYESWNYANTLNDCWQIVRYTESYA